MDKAKDKQDRQTGRQTDGGQTDWQKHMREKEKGRGRYRENMLNMTLDPFLNP